MEILEIAINAAGGISKLADKLGVAPNVVGMWKTRQRLPKSWEQVLRLKYARQSRAAKRNA